MKQLIAFAKVKPANGKAWEEDFKVSSKENAEAEVKAVIDNFNNTLKPGESERSFEGIVRYEEKDIPEDDEMPDDWDEEDEEDEWGGHDRDFDFDDDDDRYDFEDEDEVFD